MFVDKTPYCDCPYVCAKFMNYNNFFCFYLKKMYQELMTALDEAGKNDACVVAVLTGSGEYYCSGNDLGNFTRIPPEGPQKMANDGKY